MARKGQENLIPQKKRNPYQKRQDILPKVNAVLDAIADGSSMRKACKEEGIAPSSFLKVVVSEKEIFDRYARARKAQAEWLFDTLGAIEDGTLAGKIDPQAAKVAIDSRKWRLAKLHPKEYGDKSQVDVISSDGSMSPPLDVKIKIVDPKQTDE